MRKRILKSLLVMLMVSFFASCSPNQSNEGFLTPETAGEYLRQQIMEYQTEVSFSYTTDDYDDYANSDQLWNRIEEAVCDNVLNPFEGEHLFMRSWLHTPFTSVKQNRDKSYTILFETSAEYYTSADQERELEEACRALIESLEIENASEYGKILAIYRYICDNIVYDYDHPGDVDFILQYTAYAAMIDKKAVCAGISDLLYVLGKLAGLETHITIYDDHAWNFIRIKDEFYYLDATWDLGKKPSEYAYFLKGSKDFLDHDFTIDEDPYVVERFLSQADKKYQISESAYKK